MDDERSTVADIITNTNARSAQEQKQSYETVSGMLDRYDYHGAYDYGAQTPYGCVDLALALRSRCVPGELNLVKEQGVSPEMILMPREGVLWVPPFERKGEATVIVSAQHWEGFTQLLATNRFDNATVLTPELITSTGVDLGSVPDELDLISQRIADVVTFSLSQPDTTFLLGSPIMGNVLANDRLQNGVLVIKNGWITDKFAKRIGTPAEVGSFHFNPYTPPTIIGGHTVLVCRDLVGASLSSNTGRKERAIRELLNQIGIEHTGTVSFLTGQEKGIYVSALWGVNGLSWGVERHKHRMPDGPLSRTTDYFLARMEAAVQTIFMFNPSVQRIVVADRNLNVEEGAELSQTAREPMNAVFFRPLGEHWNSVPVIKNNAYKRQKAGKV